LYEAIGCHEIATGFYDVIRYKRRKATVPFGCIWRTVIPFDTGISNFYSNFFTNFYKFAHLVAHVNATIAAVAY
jgi:hypothetical protein